jgi:uncharacterized membrane protein YfcA
VSAGGFALAATAVLVGAVVQGSIGFGLNLIAAPVLALVDPALVPGPAIVLAFVFTALLAGRERDDIDLHGVRWAFYGRLPGSAAGAVAVAALSTRALSLAIGVAVLIGVAITASGRHLRPTRPVLLGAGALSGLMGTASSIGGPPMAMALAGSSGPAMRGTLSAFFLLGTFVSVGLLAAGGRVRLERRGRRGRAAAAPAPRLRRLAARGPPRGRRPAAGRRPRPVQRRRAVGRGHCAPLTRPALMLPALMLPALILPALARRRPTSPWSDVAAAHRCRTAPLRFGHGSLRS